ncbi:MAG: N-acetyltransferase [Clostridia bacterium]|nr:N-acetyltransferase [Clostridia bacterium]MBQ4619782.1 N-acetyltransferase [Clostridia bacterium]
MNLTYISMEDKYLTPSANLVEEVFTEYENEKEGKLVRRLVEEIREKDSYIKELELIAVDENDDVVGYVMMSGFHLNGNYKDKLLILTPAAVKARLQRRHIGKNLIELGFEKAQKMGYEAVIVEGNPANYQARGFVTSADHGIYPGETVHLPNIRCLMVKELKDGALNSIKGTVEYYDYKALMDE